MAILVKVSYETAKLYEGKGVTAKVGNKKHQVYFKLYCDSSNITDCISLYKASDNIVMLDYLGDIPSSDIEVPNNIYITKTYDYGMNIVEEDIVSVVNELPEFITPIIRLPLEYTDMQFIYNMSQKYKRVRFCGGTYFCLNGCNLGCCGKDILDKRNIKYDKNSYMREGCSCALDTLMEDEVTLEEGKLKTKKSPAKAKQKSTTGGHSKKKAMSFADLLAMRAN